MGKSNAPLTFLIPIKFAEEHSVELRELVDKGHTLMYSHDEYDIALGPRMWRTWTDPVTKRIANLDMAMKAARVTKKLREKK